jgi:hypothetical protein
MMRSAGRYSLQARLEGLLGPAEGTAGILHRYGRVLMSSWDFVRPSPVMVYGINPGGRVRDAVPPGESIADALRETEQGWNYFADPAAKPLHRVRVGAVLGALGASLPETPCTNVHFLRSQREQDLSGDHGTT